MKECTQCFITKDLSRFPKRKDSVDGFRHTCKDCLNNYQKDYYQNNKEKVLKNKFLYRRTEKYKLMQETFRKENKHIIAYRKSIHSALKRLNTKKEGKTLDLLGYSALDFKKNIESKFKPEMSWDNYGSWHVDHIKAVSKFKKNTSIKIVNNLNNLQPLWAIENLRKYTN